MRASTMQQEHQQEQDKDDNYKQLLGPAPQEPCQKQRSKQEHAGIHGGTLPIHNNQQTTQHAGGRS
jgi:hypothetical protein